MSMATGPLTALTSSESECEMGTATSTSSSNTSSLCLTSLPDELIAMCYAGLPANDLIALELVSSRLRDLISADGLCWRDCVQTQWGNMCSNPTLLSEAAAHAGSWKALYAEKAAAHKSHGPWLVACPSETKAMVNKITGCDNVKKMKSSIDNRKGVNINNGWTNQSNTENNAASGEPCSPPRSSTNVTGTQVAPSPVSVVMNAMSTRPDGNTSLDGCVTKEDNEADEVIEEIKPMSVVMLLDASSSVTDDDFKSMKAFTHAIVAGLRTVDGSATKCSTSSSGEESLTFMAVIQFNQTPRVELGLTAACKPKVTAAVDAMGQLMGSTDIAAPIRRARDLLRDAPRGERVIVLVTDGQTHADELRESEREARRAAEETGARVFTVGVGRDIDEVGLDRVAKASEGGMYFTLRRFVHLK